jgi:hypothetical protein
MRKNESRQIQNRSSEKSDRTPGKFKRMLTIKEGKPEVDDCSEESDQSVGRADMHESTPKLHPPGNLGNFHKIAAQHITAASGKKNSVRD